MKSWVNREEFFSFNHLFLHLKPYSVSKVASALLTSLSRVRGEYLVSPSSLIMHMQLFYVSYNAYAIVLSTEKTTVAVAIRVTVTISQKHLWYGCHVMGHGYCGMNFVSTILVVSAINRPFNRRVGHL